LLAHAGDAAGHRGEERVFRRVEARVVLGNLGHGDVAIGDLARGRGERGAELPLGGGDGLDCEHAAVNGEFCERRHGVNLPALAGAEDAADVEGGPHREALGGDKAAAREAALVDLESEDEGGHLLEGVDALLGHGAVGGLAVHGDLEPDDAVVAAADGVGLAAFHDDGVVGTDGGAFHEPAGPEDGVGLLVGGERHLDVHPRRRARGAQGLQRKEEARHGALHVGGAAAEDPAALHRAAERAAVAPPAGDGHDIVVRVEMDRLPGTARGELAEHVETREAVLLRRQGAAQQARRDRVTAGLQADGGQLMRQVGRDGVVVLARRIDGGDADELLQAGDEVGGVDVDVGGRSHGENGLRIKSNGGPDGAKIRVGPMVAKPGGLMRAPFFVPRLEFRARFVLAGRYERGGAENDRPDGARGPAG